MELPAVQTGEKSKISVTLSNTNEEQVKDFHCLTCGHVAFRYYNDVKIIVPGEGEFQKRPVEIQCRGRVEKTDDHGNLITGNCRTLYYVG